MARRHPAVAAALSLLLGWTAPAIAADRLLLARGSWTALAGARSCRAVARAPRSAAADRPQAFAAFLFEPRGKRRGELFVQLSRVVRPGASVMLTVGERPFLLVGLGDRAWSSGPAQEEAIIAVVRASSAMRIVARDRSGRRFSDRYGLAGAPSAIDAAAAACAGNW